MALDWLAHAQREIKRTYGIDIDVNSADQNIGKFGENLLVGTNMATLMTLPAGVLEETYLTANSITQVSSSDDGDTQDIVINGHTYDAVAGFTSIMQTVTLTGQTAALLGIPLARAERGFNDGSAVLAGNVYIAETDDLTAGVPDTDAKVHLVVQAGLDQSMKCALTTDASEYLIITSVLGAVNQKTAAGADVRLSWRLFGKVFRTQFTIGVNSLGPNMDVALRPYLIVPPNSDIKMSADASGASVAVSARINGVIVNPI